MAHPHRLGRRPSGTRRRLGSTPLVCAVLALCLVSTGCAEYGDGTSMARDHAAAEAKRLDEELGHRDWVRDAEYIAATEVLDPTEDGTSKVRREPLAWSGRTFGDERATIDVRFVVTVDEDPGGPFGNPGHSAGQATRCYRYLLKLGRNTSSEEIDCPSVRMPLVPVAKPYPAMPADARDRLAAALRTATPDTLAGAVRAAFPEKHVTVDTTTHENALVAVLSVPPERQCLLLVRTPGGAIEAPAYDPIWLAPGETGCNTGLYVSPPR
ncbi:hypothetical protein AB0B57_19555 [Micromonospora sp. NPDC049101]|uniref:hypothetical protein n=1 Tax=Micromonospora sp. NPDC049101 TaxID=3155032 RepID=UPI0033ECAFD7